MNALLTLSDLTHQTNLGPSLYEVATQLLRDALKTLEPALDIDPDSATIATPMSDQTFVFESLTHTLITQALEGGSADYFNGLHFLTLTPTAAAPVQLDVDMTQLSGLLNACNQMLFVTCQERQLDFWNGTVERLPRWKKLSETLKEALNVSRVPGWNTDHCTLARLIADNPTLAERRLLTPLATIKVGLPDIDQVGGEQHQHLMLDGAVIISGTYRRQAMHLMYSISHGYEAFESMSKLGESIAARLDRDLDASHLTWRLYEPDGSVFDYVVWALIAAYIQAAGTLSGGGMPSFDNDTQRVDQLSSEDKAGLTQLQASMPDWMKTASMDDQLEYSRYLRTLGKLHTQYDMSAANGDILPIGSFAQTKMRDAITADKKPGAEALILDNLTITTTDSMDVGGLLLPDPASRKKETLGEFALQNTPPFMGSLAFTDQTSVPDWLTLDYLNQKAEQLNIGDTYPALIKQTLLDDAAQATRHKASYMRLLPVLLPMRALECKLRHQGAMDERGYRLVCQSLEKPATGAVIRPLAFIPQRRLSGSSDRVANMFIITAQGSPNGLCVLYRPMFDPPFLQFPSAQNLLYALHQDGELRENVLAWLATPALSFEYASYVFGQHLPSLWTLTQLAFEPLIHLDMIGDVSLDTTPVSGDVLEHLYRENADALIALADRQSVSNRERRWALLGESGWAVFSVASNFFTGSAGTAVWVWQSIDKIQRALGDYEKGVGLINWKSIADVLLAFSILMAQRVAQRRMAGKHEGLATTPSGPPPAKQRVSITHEPLALTGTLPLPHLGALAPEVIAAPRSGIGFEQYISTFTVPRHTEIEAHLNAASHLYEWEGKHYASVGAHWFQIKVTPNGPHVIQDPKQPGLTGFEVKYDTVTQQWYWDLKLRLRGGGKTQAELARKAKLAALDQQLTEFVQLKNQLARKARADMGQHAYEQLPRQETLDLYLRQLKITMDQCQGAINQFNEWLTLGGRSRAAHETRLRVTAEHLFYVTQWLKDVRLTYNVKARAAMDGIDFTTVPANAGHLEHTRQVIALGREMIDHIQTFEKASPGLTTMITNPSLSRTQIEKIRMVNANASRVLKQRDVQYLQINEIGLSGELCISLPWNAANAQARTAVAQLFEVTCTAASELLRWEKSQKTPATASQDVTTLDGLVDRFADAAQRLAQLPEQYPEQLESGPLERVLTLVQGFQTHTISQRVTLLREQRKQQKNAPAQAGTSRAAKKSSKATASPPTPAEPASSLDEESAELIIITPKAVTPTSITGSDTTIVKQALELSLPESVDGFIQRTTLDAQRYYRIAEDVDHLFDRQASKYEQAARDVERILAKQTEEGSSEFPVSTLPKQLREIAERTRRASIGVHADMLKRKKPRQTYFQWLLDHQQIKLQRDPRGKILTQKAQDYFQEYQILDRSRNDAPLWVAHFHYVGLNMPAEQFSAAHLKIAEPYLATLMPALREQLSALTPIDYEQRKLTAPETVAMFLALEPQPAN
ncbi:hypothetical protein SOP86_02560 [Pseudomonas canadensis]|uniref:dermonecrotic toxin domain-containing protein n=1 Tax=Pseudomonas canadensis TaxID=915099 RepID=UPI002B2491DB|nr:DUF6543 domain-containing protein [Pseudomonas canadensis]MEB2644523.1 hypothetical protein [Pseudomonas canadensis]